MFYPNSSFGYYSTDEKRTLWVLVVTWTFSLTFGMLLSFWIVPSVSIDIKSLFDNYPSVVWSVVSLVFFVFAPTIAFGFLGANLFLILFMVVFKGILTGFFLTTSLLSFGAYAWLINCLLQITESLCMPLILMVWNSCLLREVNKMYKSVFLALVLCAVFWSINSMCISPLIETILSSVV